MANFTLEELAGIYAEHITIALNDIRDKVTNTEKTDDEAIEMIMTTYEASAKHVKYLMPAALELSDKDFFDFIEYTIHSAKEGAKRISVLRGLYNMLSKFGGTSASSED